MNITGNAPFLVNNNKLYKNKKCSNNLKFTSINVLSKVNLPKLQKNSINYFSKYAEIGEGSSVLLDFIGKFAVVPTLIMFNPFTKNEDKDSKIYSALKHPLAAAIQFATELTILNQASKTINNLAKTGKLGEAYNITKLTGAKLAEANTRLNLFNNRTCFIIALLSTPLVCGIENWLHPKIMRTIFPNIDQKNTSSNNKKSLNTEV